MHAPVLEFRLHSSSQFAIERSKVGRTGNKSMQPGVVPPEFELSQAHHSASGSGDVDSRHHPTRSDSAAKPMATAQLHVVGSVTDMSANWSAKVAVNAAAQVHMQSAHAVAVLAPRASQSPSAFRLTRNRWQLCTSRWPQHSCKAGSIWQQSQL